MIAVIVVVSVVGYFLVGIVVAAVSYGIWGGTGRGTVRYAVRNNGWDDDDGRRFPADWAVGLTTLLWPLWAIVGLLWLPVVLLSSAFTYLLKTVDRES